MMSWETVPGSLGETWAVGAKLGFNPDLSHMPGEQRAFWAVKELPLDEIVNQNLRVSTASLRVLPAQHKHQNEKKKKKK